MSSVESAIKKLLLVAKLLSAVDPLREAAPRKARPSCICVECPSRISHRIDRTIAHLVSAKLLDSKPRSKGRTAYRYGPYASKAKANREAKKVTEALNEAGFTCTTTVCSC